MELPKELPSRYDPSLYEKEIYSEWMERGDFTPPAEPTPITVTLGAPRNGAPDVAANDSGGFASSEILGESDGGSHARTTRTLGAVRAHASSRCCDINFETDAP